MITKIQRWGNSQGLRVSKELLSEAGMAVGDLVDVAVDDGALLVVPVRRVRGRLDLDVLVGAIPTGYAPEELDWGPATGGEVW